MVEAGRPPWEVEGVAFGRVVVGVEVVDQAVQGVVVHLAAVGTSQVVGSQVVVPFLAEAYLRNKKRQLSASYLAAFKLAVLTK